jgi:hypothetical protein
MFYTPASSFNQVNKGKRLNKKSPSDTLPIVSLVLISRAAAIARERARIQQRLDAYTLVCLFHFVMVVTRRVSELNKAPPRKWYEPEQHIPHLRRYGRFYIPADLRAAYRIQNLRERHQRCLSLQADSIITEALCWYNDLCLAMKQRREGSTLFGSH